MNPAGKAPQAFAALVMLGIAAGPPKVQSDPWSVSADRRNVTVTTRTMRAALRDGALVAIQSKVTSDSLFVPTPQSTASPSLRSATGTNSVDNNTAILSQKREKGVGVSFHGLAGDPTGETTLNLAAGSEGDLILQQTARREAPKLLSASWGIAGIDAAHVQIVVPAMGGLIIDGLRGPGAQQFTWPASWQAALIVVQGKSGGFYVWAEDSDAQFKSVDLRRYGREITLSFSTESRAAFDEARTVTSPRWHVQTYRGDWKVPAAAYRKVLAAQLSLTPIPNRTPPWIKDIRLVVRVSNDVTIDDLRGLAKEVDPKQTLLYVPGWRKLPYDVLYPDYAPRDGFVEWCHAARELGFHVMPHGNLVGIGPKSPELKQVERHLQTDRTTGDRVGWYLDKPDHPGQIFCLNPASSTARRFLIDHFHRAWEEVRFDALHLDFPVIVSTHDGDVDGMTCAHGVVEYLRELQATLPEVALGTEGLNEVLVNCSFAQLGEPFWVNPSPGMRLHPIRSFLFAPYCGLYGHLGMPSQATSFPAFLEHHDFFDKLGTLPTLSLDGPIDSGNAGTDFVLREARYFQKHRLAPAPEEVRLPNELFTWREDNGKISAVFDNPPGRRLASRDSPKELAWLLLSRQNTYDGPGTVLDWRAFAGNHLFGLNPERRYSIGSASLDPRSLHLVSSSQPIVLQEVRDNKRRALFRLSGPTAVIADLVAEASSAAAGIIVGNRQESIGSGAQFVAGQNSCGGVALPAIYAHPPWQGAALGGITYGEFPIVVPKSGRTLLPFAMGVADLTDERQAQQDKEKPLSDGVTFAVSVEDKELLREHHRRGNWAWREVDLSAYRGRQVLLRLTTGPGPKNDCGWDWALWGQPRVINLGNENEDQPLRLRLFSPHGAGSAFFGDHDQPGKVIRVQTAEGGAMIEVELPRPQPFGLLYDLTSAAAGADLSTLPFITGSTSGEMLVEGPVYGSGSIGRYEGEKGAWCIISGHTPAWGRTSLDWCLRLPKEPLRLKFHCQVAKGGGPVAFEVQINGQPLWALPMPYPNGWKEGSIDLTPWADQAMLLSLVTDSAGTNLCDWAQWGEVRVVKP